MTIPAKYENGVFRPLGDVQIKEGTVVAVLIPAEPQPTGKRRSIKGSSVLRHVEGPHRYRDSVEYLNKLRDNPRG